MTSSENKRPRFLLDSSPLSTLCSYPLSGEGFLQDIIAYVEIVISQTVLEEIRGSGKVERLVSPFLKTNRIEVLQTPITPLIVDTAYSRDLGAGERSVIKTALASGIVPVLDDRKAFVIACRFGLHPIGFQDFIITLVKQSGLPKTSAIDILKSCARDFPTTYLIHSLDMLEEGIKQ